jgi:hypothetical protein
MATAPTVQTLDQIMAELQPGYTAQREVIGKGIQNTNETYKASELALDASKTQGFNQINEQATGKGLAFGGIPIEEQADYLSTKYLPGKQAAKAKQQEDILTLEGMNASLDTDIRNKAFGSRETQQQSLNQWNLQQEAQAAAAEAARLDRDFRASQAEKDRAAQAAQAAANRAASAPKPADKTQLVLGLLKEGMGGDGYVSPGTFNLARDVWVANGGDYKTFTDTYWRYTGGSSEQYKSTDRYKSYL